MVSSQASILVVEDELIVAHSLQARLQRHGYTVIALARTGDEALSAIARQRPDLILMDIHLADDVDGIEVAERIRGQHDIPVIFLTAYSDDETLSRAKITEPFGYIIKPFEARELINNIEIAMYRKAISDQLSASEARFRGLFENAVIGLILVGPEGEIVDVNPAMAALLGRCGGFNDQITELARAARSDGPVERTITTSTGDERVLEITSAGIPRGANSEEMTALFVEDVTELYRYQTALEERREALRTLFVNEESIREHERTRLSRDIHDVLGQMLTALKMDLHWMGSHTNDTATATSSHEMIEQVDAMIVFVKKVCSELRDNVLDVFGFSVALDEHLTRFQERTGVELVRRLECDDPNLGRETEVSLLRILQESLTNITRHARATRVTVVCERTDSTLTWTITDDGVGFDADTAPAAGSLGLIGMSERASAWGGRVSITSAPGAGTTVRVDVPYLKGAGR